jgi:hypothetical protein
VLDADIERQRQQKELEAVINERDILSTQVSNFLSRFLLACESTFYK